MREIIPIFLSSDENYAPYVATTIASIVRHTEAMVQFYVLDGGIHEESRNKLQDLVNAKENASIEFIDMSFAQLGKFPDLRHYSVNTFSRYFIPQLKKDLGKVLYLDVDILVLGDIAELYRQSPGDYPVAAVLEDFHGVNGAHLAEVWHEFTDVPHYFNAGVLLLDIAWFRAHNITELLVAKTNDMQSILSCADQDVLNAFFQKNFQTLDYRFNCMPDLKKYMLESSHTAALAALEDPLIIHYVAQKPWKTHLAPHWEKFIEVAKQTPFYDKIQENFRNSILGKNGSLRKLQIRKIRYQILSQLCLGKKRRTYNEKYLALQKSISALNYLST